MDHSIVAIYQRVKTGNHAARFIIKVAITLLLLAVLYKQLVIDRDVVSLFPVFAASWSWHRIPWSLAAVFLLPVNLWLDAWRWKILVQPLVPVSLRTAFKAAAAALSIGVLTPNRVGEFAGRLLMLPPGNRARALPPSLLSSFAQFTAALLIGVPSALIWLHISGDGIFYGHQWMAAATGLAFLLALVYAFSPRWLSLLAKLPLLKRLDPLALSLQGNHGKALWRALALASLRYLVFLLQFVLLLYACGVFVPFLTALVLVSCIMLAHTLMPLPAIAQFSLRYNLGLYLIGPFTQNDFGIIVAATLLWIINLALPALAGAWWMNRTKW